MIKKIEELIISIYYMPYSKEAFKEIGNALDIISQHIDQNHFLKAKEYHHEINNIFDLAKTLSSFRSGEDKLLQKNIQRRIASLCRKILNENKKIFIVHGRNMSMRDKVSALLGRLKLDYVILESEENTGKTVIEKFLTHSQECRYAIVLFSADDIGGLNHSEPTLKRRVRQNVILELGYFLGLIGRKNIAILHEVGIDIERPSDFDGIVYEPFDDFGAWKSKLLREMRRSEIYIDQNLADRI